MLLWQIPVFKNGRCSVWLQRFSVVFVVNRFIVANRWPTSALSVKATTDHEAGLKKKEILLHASCWVSGKDPVFVNMIAKLHLQFCFPWKDQWKYTHKKVCTPTVPKGLLSIPGSLATRKQQQQPVALCTGTFLHPALFGCRTMTESHIRTMKLLAWIFSVCAHTEPLTAGRALWSPISPSLFSLWLFCTHDLIAKSSDTVEGQGWGRHRCNVTHLLWFFGGWTWQLVLDLYCPFLLAFLSCSISCKHNCLRLLKSLMWKLCRRCCNKKCLIYSLVFKLDLKKRSTSRG